MIDLSPLSREHPLPESINPPENEINKQYFDQARELALLVKTPEGINIAEQAALMITRIVEENRESLKPQTQTVPDDDSSSKNSARLDQQVQMLKWQEENQKETQKILTGQRELDNLEERIFLKVQNPDWNEGLTINNEQKKQTELFHQFCRSYGFALDYQRRENTTDSSRLPINEPGNAKLKFANTDINKVRESFKQGWQSVVLIDSQVK